MQAVFLGCRVGQSLFDYGARQGFQVRSGQTCGLRSFLAQDAPGASDPLNPADPITSGLTEVLFPYPGNFDAIPESKYKFTPIARTGKSSGTITPTVTGHYRLVGWGDNVMIVGFDGQPEGKQAIKDGFDNPEAYRDYFVPRRGDRFDGILFKW